MIINAYLNKFDEIEVHSSSNEDVFYLRDNTYEVMHEMKIKSLEVNELGFSYKCRIDFIELGHRYEVVDQTGRVVSLEIGAISKDPRFDELYDYGGNDLGVTYTPHASHFALYAPLASSAMVEYVVQGKVHVQVMERCDYGVYRTVVIGDLEGCSYVFLIEHGSTIKRVCDLYGYDATLNHQASVVVNMHSINKVIPLINKNNNPIVYEMSVRDFSVDLNVPFKQRGKFISMIEKDLTLNNHSVGIDYLKKLGISHVQLLPVHDFGSVEELQPDLRYNWGYDPIHGFVLEGSYCVEQRMNEFIEMVNGFHEVGIGVVVDIVFNHMFDVSTSLFQKTIPHYYYRTDATLKYSAGSGCGNDINSKSKMVKRYLMELIRRTVGILGVDGIRFDLMGILDIDLMNEIKEYVYQINPNFLLYGEGWNMDTMLRIDEKACIENHKVLYPIGFFNDHFRDCIKGSEEGYLGIVLNGNNKSYFNEFYLPEEQSINYVVCHDNYTLYDYLKRYKLDVGFVSICNAFVLLSGGIAFLHGGQEFLRTKQGVRDSYNQSDAMNGIDWNLSVVNESEVLFVKGLIGLRELYGGSTFAIVDEIEQLLIVENTTFRMYCNRGTRLQYNVVEEVLLCSKEYIDGSIDCYSVIICKKGE